MNVVDSSGWLEYFGKGANGEQFAPLIHNTVDLIVPVICIYEVFKRITLLRDEEEALKAMGWMTLGQVVDINQETALLAATLSIQHKLPMADSLILATTRMSHAILWTQDEHFQGLQGVQYIEKKLLSQ
jgi:predicted nucleic acid-binding protein